MAQDITTGNHAVDEFELVDHTGALISPAQDGTDGSGITPPTGGGGIRGWSSGIYKLLLGILTFNYVVSGNAVTTLLSAVTAVSNGTGAANTLVTKVFTASVAGTGFVSASVRFVGSMDGTNYDTDNPLATVVLSGTTSDFGTYVHTGPYKYIRGDVTAISGTGAAVTATVGG